LPVIGRLAESSNLTDLLISSLARTTRLSGQFWGRR